MSYKIKCLFFDTIHYFNPKNITKYIKKSEKLNDCCLNLIKKFHQCHRKITHHFLNIMTTPATPTPQAIHKKNASAHESHKASAAPIKKNTLTKIIISSDVGWGNALYIRGDHAGLTWEKGILMDNITPDRWEWKTVTAHPGLNFKILINDQIWQKGENLHIHLGETMMLAPEFETHG